MSNFGELRQLPLDVGALDLVAGSLHRPEGRLALTEVETALLRYLAARPGVAVARDVLYAEVWGYGPQVLSRALDKVVRRLRVKIERDPSRPRHLLTALGVGYRFATTGPRPA
ncbi:MAG: winged helix-turn-helix domain-containing protein, partial [Myxococcota bacterium]